MLSPPSRVMREDAITTVRSFLLRRYSPDQIQGWCIYMSKRPLRPGELRLRTGHNVLESPDPAGSWVAFVDQRVMANFAHDCLYVLVDPSGSTRFFAAGWFPKRWQTRCPDWNWVNLFWVYRALKNEVIQSMLRGGGLVVSVLRFLRGYAGGLWSIPRDVWGLCVEPDRWGLYQKVNSIR